MPLVSCPGTAGLQPGSRLGGERQAGAWFRPARLAFAVLAFCAGCRTPVPEGRFPDENISWRGRQTNLMVGLRSFDDERWEPLEDQVLWGIDYCEPIGLEAVRLEAGFQYSWDESSARLPGGQGVELHAETFEFSAGLNASYPIGRLRPYVGGGAALLFSDTKFLDQGAIVRDDDSTMGGYGKAGLLFQVSQIAHVGIEYRLFAGGAVSLGNDEVDADSGQFAIVFGTSF